MNDDASRQFVDTNVLVYAFDASATEKHNAAKALLNSLWRSRQGCISIQVLQEFYVTITRKVASPHTFQEAAKIVEDLSVWRVHAPVVADVLAAIELQTRYQLSFWDAMILQSANTLGCETIWTEDLNDGQLIDQTMIRNPFRPN